MAKQLRLRTPDRLLLRLLESESEPESESVRIKHPEPEQHCHDSETVVERMFARQQLTITNALRNVVCVEKNGHLHHHTKLEKAHEEQMHLTPSVIFSPVSLFCRFRT